MTDDTALPAGEFVAWLGSIRGAIRGEAPADVPCGTCTACCTSSQFVHIGPEESTALARIPRALLFQAPGLPKGHLVMGYDSQGRCPMLVDDGCSIYDDRPQTCRMYDCRVFAATGLASELATDGTKALIAARAARWQFSYADSAARARHASVVTTAVTLRRKHGPGPTTTELAVRAVESADD